MDVEPRDGDSRPLTAPLTERVLRRLGRPRWMWIGLWAAVPLLSPLVFGTAVVLSGRPFGTAGVIDLVATQAVLVYVCFVFLWGSGELARQATSVKQDVAGIVSGEPPVGLYDGVGSVGEPLALTVLAVAVVSAGGFLQYGLLPPLAALPLLFVYMVPILTFSGSTYGSWWTSTAWVADQWRSSHFLRTARWA